MTWLGSGIKYQGRGLKIERVSISESEFLKCLSCPFHSIYHIPWHYHFCKWGSVSFGTSRWKWNQKGRILLAGFFCRRGSCHLNANCNIFGLGLAYMVPFKWRPKLENFALLTYPDLCLIHFNMGAYLMMGWETSHLVLFHLHVDKQYHESWAGFSEPFHWSYFPFKIYYYRYNYIISII